MIQAGGSRQRRGHIILKNAKLLYQLVNTILSMNEIFFKIEMSGSSVSGFSG